MFSFCMQSVVHWQVRERDGTESQKGFKLEGAAIENATTWCRCFVLKNSEYATGIRMG